MIQFSHEFYRVLNTYYTALHVAYRGCLWIQPNACYPTWPQATCNLYASSGYQWCGSGSTPVTTTTSAATQTSSPTPTPKPSQCGSCGYAHYSYKRTEDRKSWPKLHTARVSYIYTMYMRAHIHTHTCTCALRLSTTLRIVGMHGLCSRALTSPQLVACLRAAGC